MGLFGDGKFFVLPLLFIAKEFCVQPLPEIS